MRCNYREPKNLSFSFKPTFEASREPPKRKLASHPSVLITDIRSLAILSTLGRRYDEKRESKGSPHFTDSLLQSYATFNVRVHAYEHQAGVPCMNKRPRHRIQPAKSLLFWERFVFHAFLSSAQAASPVFEGGEPGAWGNRWFYIG